MKYINVQKHNTSCGPIAIMNTIKWLGGSISYDYIDMFRAFSWSQENGTDALSLSNTLKSFNIKYNLTSHPTVKDIEKVLKRGNACILLYVWYFEGKSGAHYVFIDEDSGDYFRAMNFTCDGWNIAPKFVLGKWFRSSKRWGDYRPIVWEITK